MLHSKSLRPSLVAAVVLSSAYQLTGVSGVSTNLGKIFSRSGLNDSDTRLATIAVFSTMILVRVVMVTRGFLVFFRYKPQSFDLFRYILSKNAVGSHCS